MAQLARTRVDDLLEQLMATWEDVPAVAAEFDGWDLLEQLTYTEEWPLYDDKLFQLNAFIERGQLTAAQRERYTELRRLMERNRPLLDRMMR